MPCPVCTSHAHVRNSRIPPDSELPAYWVECVTCEVGTKFHATEAQAAETWNTRSEDVESLRARVAELDKRAADLQLDKSTLIREREGEVWIWQGDEEDHPESLACPVLIQPEDLRAILGAAERVKQACVAKVNVLVDQYGYQDDRFAELAGELEAITLAEGTEHHEAEADPG